MFQFYESENFKLFPCNIDKTPRVSSWRSSEAHIDAESADRIASTGTYIGAWVPPNYVIIDIDRGHKEGQDGGPTFQKLCRDNGIDGDLSEKTMAVKTGSGGLHLYFTLPEGTDYRTLSQKSIADSVDVRTHLGYVIAAGTNGYYSVNDARPIEIPAPLLSIIQTRNKDKAKSHIPSKELPIEVLEKVLAKVPVEEFDNNDAWQEFVTACIAVSGNSEEALDAIEKWSKQDNAYANDPNIRKRLETFEPEGGITAGTFVHIIKRCGVSKYMIDKVRMFVGAQFNVTSAFSEYFDTPFSVDYTRIHEMKEIMRSAYYSKSNLSSVELVAALSGGNLIYVNDERAFYHFDGVRWIESAGALRVIASVLMNAGQHWYTDVSKKEDADADEYITSYINYTNVVSTLQRLEAMLKQHPDIAVQKVDWDADTLQATLTLRDCVMDFSSGDVTFRAGEREEYRKRYIDLAKSAFDDRRLPENFREFLKDVFPDKETRKTATYALSTMLSGTGKFRKFQIWNGAGSNGKSTLMEIMKEVLGDRAISYKPEILLNKAHVQSLTPELAMFRGALAAFASETEESKRVSQGSVKALTGDETITANPKYKGVIQFRTTFQLVLSTNYLPTFSAHDAAFIDRVLVLPFYTCFYKSEEQSERAKRMGSQYFVEAKDPSKIREAVLEERAQILYYLAKRYQELENDIPESLECRQAKSHYIEDNNDIFKFLEEFVEFSEAPENGKKYYFTPTKDLVNFYNEENNTRYSAKYVSMRVREVYPLVDTFSKNVDGRLTRGLKHIRIKYGAYPEGWQGNYTPEEVEQIKLDNAEF